MTIDPTEVKERILSEAKFKLNPEKIKYLK